jgi:hypothetical protein
LTTSAIYGAHETRFYYVEESQYGVTPTNPTMNGILPAENVEPAINPSNIKVRGIGSIDLQAIKKGLRVPSVKIAYALPSDSPIGFLQWAKVEPDKSLSVQMIYYKGIFASATDIISLLHKGCKFQRVTVECSVEGVVKASAELLGQDLEVGTSKITGATYGDHTGAVPFYESYVKKGGTAIDRVTDWKFTIENNLKPVPVIKSDEGYVLKYLPHRHRNLTGELTFEFESKEEFEDVINDDQFSLEFGLGGTNKAVLSNCKWENVSTPTRIEELIALKAQFVANTVAIS